MNIKNTLKKVPLITIPYRLWYAHSYYVPQFRWIFRWAFQSREFNSFTYPLTPFNLEYLLHHIAIITRMPYTQIESYFHEINDHQKITEEINKKIASSKYKFVKNKGYQPGSRAAYYCILRAVKPKVVVENGIELGYTAILLCEALLKNADEGYPGHYLGLDIDPEAGLLIRDQRYSKISSILIGDSLKSLAQINEPIDFYFSDGERSYAYEKAEFALLKQKTSSNAVIVSNKLQISDCTSTFAREMNRKHIYFREEPYHHWYPGSHIGIVYQDEQP